MKGLGWRLGPPGVLYILYVYPNSHTEMKMLRLFIYVYTLNIFLYGAFLFHEVAQNGSPRVVKRSKSPACMKGAQLERGRQEKKPP